MVDAEGFETTYTYDNTGNALTVTDPEGGVRQFSYTPEGKLATRTDKNGNVTAFAYDADQNLSQTTYADEALNARLEHFVKELNQVIYGKRSEKLSQDERQLAFEDIEVAQSEAEAQSDTIEMSKPRKKRQRVERNLGHLPDHLERIEVVVEPDSIVCPCGCGDMIRIGEDRTERLEIIPAGQKWL